VHTPATSGALAIELRAPAVFFGYAIRVDLFAACPYGIDGVDQPNANETESLTHIVRAPLTLGAPVNASSCTFADVDVWALALTTYVFLHISLVPLGAADVVLNNMPALTVNIYNVSWLCDVCVASDVVVVACVGLCLIVTQGTSTSSLCSAQGTTIAQDCSSVMIGSVSVLVQMVGVSLREYSGFYNVSDVCTIACVCVTSHTCRTGLPAHDHDETVRLLSWPRIRAELRPSDAGCAQ
jgi:hypothetical protein